VLPSIGLVFLVPVLFTATGFGGSVLNFVSPLPYPISLCGPILGAWFFAGILYLAFLSARHPKRLKETRRIFVSGEEV
jgi:hypothetical protein